MISLTLTLISFLSSGLGSGLVILWAPHATVMSLGSGFLMDMSGLAYNIQTFLLDKAVGGCDQDDGVTAQEDYGTPEETSVTVEEGALPGELVLIGNVTANDPLVTLPSTSSRIF